MRLHDALVAIRAHSPLVAQHLIAAGVTYGPNGLHVEAHGFSLDWLEARRSHVEALCAASDVRLAYLGPRIVRVCARASDPRLREWYQDNPDMTCMACALGVCDAAPPR